MATSLEKQAYVDRVKSLWPSLPLGMSVCEFHGDGDPFFGGCADDRPLGKAGEILTRPYRLDEIATFATIEDAHAAVQSIPNRRPGSRLGVMPWWR